MACQYALSRTSLAKRFLSIVAINSACPTFSSRATARDSQTRSFAFFLLRRFSVLVDSSINRWFGDLSVQQFTSWIDCSEAFSAIASFSLARAVASPQHPRKPEVVAALLGLSSTDRSTETARPRLSLTAMRSSTIRKRLPVHHPPSTKRK